MFGGSDSSTGMSFNFSSSTTPAFDFSTFSASQSSGTSASASFSFSGSPFSVPSFGAMSSSAGTDTSSAFSSFPSFSGGFAATPSPFGSFAPSFSSSSSSSLTAVAPDIVPTAFSMPTFSFSTPSFDTSFSAAPASSLSFGFSEPAASSTAASTGFGFTSSPTPATTRTTAVPLAIDAPISSAKSSISTANTTSTHTARSTPAATLTSTVTTRQSRTSSPSRSPPLPFSSLGTTTTAANANGIRGLPLEPLPSVISLSRARAVEPPPQVPALFSAPTVIPSFSSLSQSPPAVPLRAASSVTASRIAEPVEPRIVQKELLAARFTPSNHLSLYPARITRRVLSEKKVQDSRAAAEDGELTEQVPKETIPNFYSELDIVREVGWQDFDNDTRSLLHSWREIFLHIERIRASASLPISDEFLQQLCLASRQYRAELKAFIAQAAIARATADPTAALDEFELLEVAFCIWHLCEIFLVDPSRNVTAQMVLWLQESIEAPSLAFNTVEEFWTALYRLTIQGRVVAAKELIKSPDVANVFPPESLVVRSPELFLELFDAIPSLGSRRLTPDQFLAKSQSWKTNIQHLLEENEDIRSEPAVGQLLQIFLGQELEAFAAEWYELLVAKLIFEHSTADKEDLQYLAIECLQLKTGLDNPMADTEDGIPVVAPLDRCFKAIMEMAVEESVQMINQLIDLRWFVAHLVHLLKVAGRLTASETMNIDLAQGYLLQYVESIMFYPSLWQLGADYLLHSPANVVPASSTPSSALLEDDSLSGISVYGTAIEYARQLVAHQHPSDDRTANKLLHLCAKFNLLEEGRALCLQMGLAAWRRHMFGSAAHWLTHPLYGDPIKLTSLCEQLLDDRFSGRSMSLDDIEAVVASVADVPHVHTQSRSLAFLVKYRDLAHLRDSITEKEEQLAQHMMPASAISASASAGNELITNLPRLTQELKELGSKAAEILVRSLTLPLASRRYFGPLLSQELVPLLSKPLFHSTPLLCVADTYKLLSCLEDICVSHNSDQYVIPTPDVMAGGVQSLAITRDQVEEIRLALTSNLKNAIIYEASTLKSTAATPLRVYSTAQSRLPPRLLTLSSAAVSGTADDSGANNMAASTASMSTSLTVLAPPFGSPNRSGSLNNSFSSFGSPVQGLMY